jgi:sarcosine oxidase
VSARRPIRQAEFVVVGGGVVGAATALALARRDREVALLERDPLLRAQGSSRGSARILQPAAYPDESYLEMGLRAADRWRELESVTGTQLLSKTGGLAWGEPILGQADALASAGVEHELISAPEALARFSIGLPDEPIVYQPDAAVIHASDARRALLHTAQNLGAELHQRERVIEVVPSRSGMEVETDRAKWRCACAVIAAGPWTSHLLEGTPLRPPLSVSSQTVVYFDLPTNGRRPPTLVDFGAGEPYGLWDPREGLKFALHERGPVVDPDADPRAPDREALRRTIDWARSRIAGLTGEPRRVETCLYTNTPDERFILERHGALVIGSACSGQGFQFAPESGERLARLATGAEVPTEVSA